MTCVRVVTGASGMVGAVLTRHLAQLPGTLLAVDTHPGEPDPAQPVTLVDITSQDFTDLLADHLHGAGRAELYHAAGHVPGLARITDTPVENFVRTVAGNLTATYATLRAFALASRQAGVPAAAVLLSSVGATRAHRYLVGYDAAKAGTESLTRSFTLEFGEHLAVRAVALGPIAQSATTAADGERSSALVSLVPRGTYADLEEVAEAVAALGSPCFDTATGHTLTLDGGLTVQLRPATIERPPAGADVVPAAHHRGNTGQDHPPNHVSGGTR
ncbi:SDR family NAD(P)-dependent oxidoreductase [Streptomyces sp. NPDC058247]|uniref:SDR family NAD(P)-dependent oxidoreductase n=1 Tax=Streptomyces sp. NPDC058247 TaxID=3346401 RepID=UPI0036F08D72